MPPRPSSAKSTPQVSTPTLASSPCSALARRSPASYRIAKNAEVTVLLFVKQKVTANFAFRAGELTEDKIKEVMTSLPKIVEGKKK